MKNELDTVLNEFNKLKISSAKMYVSITVLICRNVLSRVEDDENPETGEFYILSTSAFYAQTELGEFLEHGRSTVNSRIENTHNQLQGSGWIIREIVKFEITICKFAKGILGHYKSYPQGLRARNQVFNPRTSENCVLISIAASMYLKQHPNIEPQFLERKINGNSREFWQDRINISSLNSNSIGWESLCELEKLNKVIFFIYKSTLQNNNNRKFCIQLAHYIRTNYEKIHLLLLENDQVCLIRNLHNFYHNFYRNQPISNMFCWCLTVFEKEEDCSNHTSICNAQTTIEYAQLGECAGFQKAKSLYPHPYVAFLDFESFNKKLDGNNINSQQIATQHAFAHKYSLINIMDQQNPVVAKENTY